MRPGQHYCGHACAGRAITTQLSDAALRARIKNAVAVRVPQQRARLEARIRNAVPDGDVVRVYHWAWRNGYRQGTKERRQREER